VPVTENDMISLFRGVTEDDKHRLGGLKIRRNVVRPILRTQTGAGSIKPVWGARARDFPTDRNVNQRNQTAAADWKQNKSDSPATRMDISQSRPAETPLKFKTGSIVAPQKSPPKICPDNAAFPTEFSRTFIPSHLPKVRRQFFSTCARTSENP